LRIEINLFSHLRLELGRSLTVDLPDGATVAAAMDQLEQRVSPPLRSMIVDRDRGGYRLVPLVNGRRGRAETVLANGDVVSLLPPLGGG
jgi:molybdopterin converting factor small subunit